MPVTDMQKNPQALTLTAVAEIDAPVERVWRLWQDPRELERWWGPPGWPATFEQHELTPGQQSKYHMTGPEGEKMHGWWKITAVEEPRRLELEDGFADDQGNPDMSMPTTKMVMSLEAVDGNRTRMTTVTTFPDAETLDKMIEMGVEQGFRDALNQIDGVVAG